MPKLSTIRILVVDDQKSMRDLARVCLRELGIYSVETADGVTQAMERLGEARYDLVVSDWNMDGESGLDLLRKIRGHPILAKTPFVMATTESSASYVVAAKEAGVSHYIVKPYSTANLCDRLEKVLGPLT